MDSLGNYPLWSAVHPDVKAAQLKAVRHLQNAHGVSVEKVSSLLLSLQPAHSYHISYESKLYIYWIVSVAIT